MVNCLMDQQAFVDSDGRKRSKRMRLTGVFWVVGFDPAAGTGSSGVPLMLLILSMPACHVTSGGGARPTQEDGKRSGDIIPVPGAGHSQ